MMYECHVKRGYHWAHQGGAYDKSFGKTSPKPVVN